MYGEMIDTIIKIWLLCAVGIGIVIGALLCVVGYLAYLAFAHVAIAIV